MAFGLKISNNVDNTPKIGGIKLYIYDFTAQNSHNYLRNL